MKTRITILIIGLISVTFIKAQDTISLAGQWKFNTNAPVQTEMSFGKSSDPGNRQNGGQYFDPTVAKFADTILLPASMPERDKGDEVTAETQWVGSLYDSSYYFNPYMKKYRERGNVKFPFFLTPNRHYVGKAWYKRQIDIPKDWDGRYIELFLERPHIISTLWVNGQRVGSEESLSVPHCYDVSKYVRPGQNDICIEVDNDPDKVGVGQDSHSVTDQTQGDWNGIVGKMELRSMPAVFIAHIGVYPDVKGQKAKVVIRIGEKDWSQQNGPNHRKKLKLPSKARDLALKVELFNSDKHQKVDTLIRISRDQLCSDSLGMFFTTDIHGLTETWDEFSPALYRLTATLGNGATSTTTFGMREISIDGRQFLLNGKRIMLRGTVENCCFPHTGYPPTDKEEWLRVLGICKRYGLNHVRFHSYCPPEAAFEAADQVGIYLQPEGPSWPNHGVSLGRGEKIDTYLMDETKKMTMAYGNHPSFLMLSAGNEPRGNWVAWVSDFVDYWKGADPRRVYTGASVGGGWQWQPRNQYHVKAGARGLTWDKQQPQSMDDFTAGISSFYDKATRTTFEINEPFVTHECGQWCAFPDLDETTQYTGVNRAKNFEIFRDLLADNDMSDMARKFLISSGKLQTLCYKYEIERINRTPDYAGYQLLSLNDYSGQGSAIVGVLNVFFREKGYCNAEDFTQFCSPLVPLAKFPKFTFKNTEEASVEIAVSNYTGNQVVGKQATYKITDSKGNDVRHGVIGMGGSIPVGYSDIDEIALPLGDIHQAEQLTLTVSIDGHSNQWEFWVYPDEKQELEAEEGILITDTLDGKAMKVLEKGGKVLICAPGKISYGKDIVQHYLPVFWNTSWFKMRPPHTTGAYIDSSHPVFRDFPTDDFSNLNWWELLNNAQVMQLTDFPKGFHPIVQSIDTWFVSRKIGMLFEANVLNGKLMMTSMDLTSQLDRRIVARQLRRSIINYMKSDAFQPLFTVEPERISDLFTKIAPPVDMFTKDSPDELKPKIN